ncbi:MAG: 30S ribosomal protein S3 [Candidatus Paraimprobicoccus trichonymphae]|uniref:Small ribosomal subunit protein uS3 n=1 Tax=Candidatus Paraimprobicoccus trichonymphae TaxID=3033793 RepID=A0AA48KW82_9FIRM|nr:MAG: 30S ribosomal protein S3 [Candidatus Paraimprobicoccus trichonymphae]
MGQKVNPHGLRVGVIKGWDSRWFFTDKKLVVATILEDYKLRKVLKKRLYMSGVPKIEIERDSSKVRLNIHCSKPGMIIGKGGVNIEKLKSYCEKLIKKPVFINIIEVKNSDLNSQLVAENVSRQLERRLSFRRVVKQSIGRSMKSGAKGIKIEVSGRLNGAEIARSEHYHEGTIPLHTLRADVEYGFSEANTTYGKIGVKAWIYKGEILRNTNNKLSTENTTNNNIINNANNRGGNVNNANAKENKVQKNPQRKNDWKGVQRK